MKDTHKAFHSSGNGRNILIRLSAMRWRLRPSQVAMVQEQRVINMSFNFR